MFGVVADARLLPFPPDCFGYVFCSNIIEHLVPAEVPRAILSLKEVTAGTLQVDVPNDSVLLTILRRQSTRMGLFLEVEYEDSTLMHHASLDARNLSGEGFEVHGCVHWLSRERIRLGRLWDLYDAVAWHFPSVAGTLIGLYTKAGDLNGPASSPK